MKRLGVWAVVAAATAAMWSGTSAGAAMLPITGYSYLAGPSGSYPDSSGMELRDGITASLAWGAGISLGYSDVAGLAGWLNSSPSIQFNFASPQTVQQVIVWAADSDGYAGVGLPSSILLTAPGGFSQSFSIYNPLGNGSTIPLILGGFEFTASSFTVTATPVHTWTMLSEVQAFSTPEPAALGLMLTGGTVLLNRRRRHA